MVRKVKNSVVVVDEPVAPPKATSANLCCPSEQMRYAGRLVNRIQKVLFSGLALSRRPGSAYEFFLGHGGVRVQIHAADGESLPGELVDQFQSTLFGSPTDAPVTNRLTATAVDAAERSLVPVSATAISSAASTVAEPPRRRRSRKEAAPVAVVPAPSSSPIPVPPSPPRVRKPRSRKGKASSDTSSVSALPSSSALLA